MGTFPFNMQKQEYIEYHGFSDSLPRDPSGRILPIIAFAESIEEFLTDHFSGSVRVNNLVRVDKLISVTPEYAAFFFKTLLCYIYGRVFLNITISADHCGLVIEIESDDDLPLTDLEFRQIIKTARNAKMHILLTKRKISLTLKYAQSKRHRVYALSEGKLRMLAKLGEIFFCGEPIIKSDDTGSEIPEYRKEQFLSLTKNESTKREKIDKN